MTLSDNDHTMKKLTFLLLIAFPIFLKAQTIVTLSVIQPPEFGFEVGNQDTTIVRGESITLGQDLTVYGGSGEYSFFWSPGSSLNDSTIMNPLASPEDTTTYDLTVVDNYGCSFSVNYKVSVRAFPVSADYGLEKNNTLLAKLYPNPNDGRFKVHLTGEPKEKIELTVIDNSGRIIQRQSIRNFIGEHTEVLELSLPNGIYTLLIRGGEDRIQRQFIIN